MMSISNWKRICMAALMACAFTSLNATDEEPGHEPVNTRPVSFTFQMAKQGICAVEDEEELTEEEEPVEDEELAEGEEAAEESDEEDVEGGLLDEEEMVMGAYYQNNGYPRSYDASQHWPTGRSVNGDTLDTEDGCKYEVYKGDAQITIDWKMNDRLVVKANSDRLSRYPFIICNLDTDNYIHANLAVGPFTNGAYTVRIAHIDYGRNRAIAYDGSGLEVVFSLSSYDKDVVRRWATGDSVVVGVNDDWLSWWNPYIFVNVSTLEYARGNVSTY